ncbi:MAG: hypothetical protein U1E78_03345 [Gammaproteobacteria bacterium]
MFTYLKKILYGNLSPDYAQVVELIRQRQTDEIQRMDLYNLSMEDVFDLILNARIEAKKNEDNYYYTQISRILFEKMSRLSGVSSGYILKKLVALPSGEQSVEASNFLIDLLKTSQVMPSSSLVNSLNLAIINAIEINQRAIVADVIQYAFSLSQETGNSVLNHFLESVELRLGPARENLLEQQTVFFRKRQAEESGFVIDGNRQNPKRKKAEFDAPEVDSEMKIEEAFSLVDQQQVSLRSDRGLYRF